MIKRSNPNPKVQQKLPNNSDSFLEALRSLGDGVVNSFTHDVAGGITQELFNQVLGKKSGELKPGETLNLNKLSGEKLKNQEKRPPLFSQDFLDIRSQEKLIWNQEKERLQLQIAAILEELKKLASATQRLTKEIETTAHQAPPKEAGIYHLSFFEKIRQFLIILRKKIENSTTWLAAFNQRIKKRNYYWAQVRKSGTKFMLSQERYMATQVG